MESSRPASEYKSQVMAATDIVEVIGKTVLLKKRGKSYLGLCPFHSEKSPSFSVDPVKQYFYCFGCKEKGDSISFVMKRDRVNFLDALRQLGDAAGIPMPERGPGGREKSGLRKQLLDANSRATDLFEKWLTEPRTGQAGREYLHSRGFSDESIQKFRLGLALDSWDSLISAPVFRSFDRQLLATAGLVKPRERDGAISGYYDTFRNRLMFPIRDPNGQVIAFGGRVMPGSADPAKYLNSPETPLFSKSRCVFGLDLARQRIVESRTVAVVEGYTDVVMAHQYGATNVVSVLGTALTEHHVAILRRFADRIVLLFDPDNAGDLAVNRAVELFLTQPIEILIASLPDDLDPDEFLVKYGLTAFDEVLDTAQDALTYKWKQLSKEFNGRDDLTGQQKAVQEYLDLLARARGSGPVDSIRWGQAIVRVSRLTGIPVQDLNNRFKVKRNPGPGSNGARSPQVQANAGQGSKNNVRHGGEGELAADTVPNESAEPAMPPRRSGPLTAMDRSERWILAVLLAEPQRWYDIQRKISVEHFTDETRRQLAELYWNHQRDEGEPVFAEFLSGMTNTAVSDLAVDLMQEFDTMTDPQQELADAMAFLESQKHRQAMVKHLADIGRTSPNTPAGSGVDPLLVLQEQARKADLRRTGT